jgi:hypothetical protein
LIDVFVEVPLIKQLEKLFIEEDFRNLFQNVFERESQKTSKMYDGLLYKEARQKKQMSHEDITFTWNTDGVPLFKSYKISMWPLFLCTNELLYNVRSNYENLLLVGLWIGPKKTEMLTFLSLCIEQLRQLEKGIDIPLNDGHNIIRLRGFWKVHSAQHGSIQWKIQLSILQGARQPLGRE